MHTSGARPTGCPSRHFPTDVRSSQRTSVRTARFVATADAAGAVTLWEMSTRRARWKWVGKRASTALAFSPDGDLLLTAGADKKARLLRVADGVIIHALPGHRRRLLTASFGPGRAQARHGEPRPHGENLEYGDGCARARSGRRQGTNHHFRLVQLGWPARCSDELRPQHARVGCRARRRPSLGLHANRDSERRGLQRGRPLARHGRPDRTRLAVEQRAFPRHPRAEGVADRRRVRTAGLAVRHRLDRRTRGDIRLRALPTQSGPHRTRAEAPRAARRLTSANDLLVVEGHHEYVTAHEYDVVTDFRDRGGNLMFLSANNFFCRVDIDRDVITRVGTWAGAFGRPAAGRRPSTSAGTKTAMCLDRTFFRRLRGALGLSSTRPALRRRLLLRRDRDRITRLEPARKCSRLERAGRVAFSRKGRASSLPVVRG